MGYSDLVKELAVEFTNRPFDFVTEADLQVRAVQLLRARLQPATVAAPSGSDRNIDAVSYKREYAERVYEKLADSGSMQRVHTEVSFDKGRRFDVVILKPSLEEGFDWVSSGSKRFHKVDADAVIGLKYIKNKTFFPVRGGITGIDDSDSVDADILKTSANKLESDLRSLNDLPSHVEKYLLVCSNNNYLYEGELTDAERDQPIREAVGRMARRWLCDVSDEVEVHYAHPLGHVCLTEPEKTRRRQ